MSRKSHSRYSAKHPPQMSVPLTRRREVRIVAAVAAAFAILAAAIILSDRSVWSAPDRLVTIFRVHGCHCAFQWEHGLSQEGFTVVMHEMDSLRSIRQRLRTPIEARGCHVAKFLDYFVEGHVDPAALRELSRRRPSALGVSTETSVKTNLRHVDLAGEAGGRVLLVGPNADTSVWYQPRALKGARDKKEEDRS